MDACKVWRLAMLFGFANCPPVLAQSLPEPHEVQQEIVRLQHVIAAAIVARDIATLDRLHAAEFTYVEGTGRLLDKSETLASYRASDFRELAYDSLTVSVYGSTAVVTGWGRAVIHRDAQPMEILARVSRVHVRRDDAWPVVLYQVTRLPQPSEPAGVGPGPEEHRIRSARAALNRALAARDTAVFARYWLENSQITAGSGQILPNGRRELVRLFAETFADPEFVSGERRPTLVEVNAAQGLAAEHGDWIWQHRLPAGLRRNRGRYLVMWRSVDGEWRIQSELYVTLGCEGAGCPEK